MEPSCPGVAQLVDAPSIVTLGLGKLIQMLQDSKDDQAQGGQPLLPIDDVE
jgi:hypothetical protein